MITPEDRQKEDLATFLTEQVDDDTEVKTVGVNSLPDIKTGEVVASLLMPTFALIAVKAGEHWALSPDEAEIAGEAYGAVIDKYYPDAGSRMGVEVTALLVTAGLIMPRMMVKKSKPAAKVESKEVGNKSDDLDSVNGGFGAVDEIRGVRH